MYRNVKKITLPAIEELEYNCRVSLITAVELTQDVSGFDTVGQPRWFDKGTILLSDEVNRPGAAVFFLVETPPRMFLSDGVDLWGVFRARIAHLPSVGGDTLYIDWYNVARVDEGMRKAIMDAVREFSDGL